MLESICKIFGHLKSINFPFPTHSESFFEISETMVHVLLLLSSLLFIFIPPAYKVCRGVYSFVFLSVRPSLRVSVHLCICPYKCEVFLLYIFLTVQLIFLSIYYYFFPVYIISILLLTYDKGDRLRIFYIYSIYITVWCKKFAFRRQWHWPGVYVSPCSHALVLQFFFLYSYRIVQQASLVSSLETTLDSVYLVTVMVTPMIVTESQDSAWLVYYGYHLLLK